MGKLKHKRALSESQILARGSNVPGTGLLLDVEGCLGIFRPDTSGLISISVEGHFRMTQQRAPVPGKAAHVLRQRVETSFFRPV